MDGIYTRQPKIKQLLTIVSVLFFLIPVRGIAGPEPIDVFYQEIILGLHDLQLCKGTMTVQVMKHIPNSDYSPVKQEVKYRFVNDSVFVRRYTDRLFHRSSYFVLRGDQIIAYDRKMNCPVSTDMITTKDSAGFLVERRVVKSDVDSVIFYKVSRYDSIRDCNVTFLTNSKQPGLEQVCEVYKDSVVTNDFQSQNGLRIRTQKLIYVKNEIGDMAKTEVYTTTTFIGDSSTTHEHKVVTHFQHYRSGRIQTVTKIEYEDGSAQYSKIHPAHFYFDE